MTQLALEVEPEQGERRYGCCGMPAPSLKEMPTVEKPFPHADDCPNPNVGSWIDRATGCTVRSMWCSDTARLGGACPYGGKPPARPGTVDPYGGACCKSVAEVQR